MSRALIIVGCLLITLGLLWPWLSKTGLGHLPGDIVIERKNFRFYFPLTTSIVVSVIVTLIIWLLRR